MVGSVLFLWCDVSRNGLLLLMGLLIICDVKLRWVVLGVILLVR